METTNLWRKFTTWILTAMLIVFLMPAGMQYAFGAVSGAPATQKTLYDNGDGTYTLSLSVTGAAESSSTTQVTKANVILVLDTSNSMNSNYTTYNGTRMTRLNAEKRVLTDDDGIIDKLLAQNVAGDPVKSDIIEVAIANFGTRGSTAQSFTTNGTTLKSTVNGLTNSQGTNWEEGLMRAQELAASIKSSQPNEEVYIIFLTDGEPTTHNGSYNVNTNYATEWGYANDNARAIVTAGYHFYGIFTWGSGTSSHYLSSLVNYAYTGSGNSNTSLDPAYAQYFTDATDTNALIEALNQITHDITSSVGYTNVDLEDGVTSMTTSNIKTTAGGEVTGLKYYRSGGSYGTADPANGKYGTEWAEAPDATVNENGEVDWDLGDIVLEDGVTYTCTFVVWPSQESLDLVADLNNGVVDYDDLTADQKSQIAVSGGTYTLKTNTDYPTVTYSTVTTTTVDGESHTVISEPQTATITNPDPVGLAGSKLNAIKSWEDTLDPSQREEIEDVVLYLKVDGHYYYVDEAGNPMGVTLTEESNWTETDYISIAPGLMVTEESPAYDPDATHVTWDGHTYAILEEGHDYIFEESDINSHYELTAYTHHPMIMGENSDGTPHIVDIVFTKDASGNITGIESVVELGDNISATNTMKGGINISKKVVDESGAEIANTDPFEVKVTMVDPEGNALPTKTADGTEYTIDYRIYYGPNNPNYDAASGGGRSDHIYKTGTEFTETLYVGDVIRVVNVEDDTLYVVEETPGAGYELDDIAYTIAYGTEEAAGAEPVTLDGKDYYTVEGNSASYAEVTNKYTYGGLKISKTVDGDDPTFYANDEFEFTFKLFDKEGEGQKELTGRKYNYTVFNADGSEFSTGTVTSGGTITLKDGQYAVVEKLPEGAYYEVTETAKTGYTTKVGTEETNKASGTVVKNAEATADFINVPEETQFKVIKNWNDEDFVGKGGYQRPSDLTVTLKGEVTVDDKTSTVSTSDPVTVGTDNDWSHTWKNLAKYYNGTEIAYTVTESGASGAGYKTTITPPAQDNSGNWSSTVTNTPVESREEYTPVDLKIIKKDAVAGGVLEGATFEVKDADGNIVGSDTTDENGEATITFTVPGTYTMTEKAPNGYNSPTPGSWTIVVEKGELVSVTFNPGTEEGDTGFWSWLYKLVFGDGTDYKNGTLTVNDPPTTTSVEVKKVWSDSDNQDGKRPESVTYQLYKKVGKEDPVAVSGKTQTLTGTGNEWTATFADLPAFENGEAVTYTIKEMNGNTAVDDGDKLKDKTGEATYTAAYSNSDLTVTNSYETETVTVEAVKSWDDEDFDGKAGYNRPESVTFNLLADGTPVTGQSKTVDADSQWKATWAGLDKYKDGTEIVYTVTEDVLPNYTTTVEETEGETTADFAFTVVNTPKTVELDTTTAIEKTVVADGTAWAKKTFNFTIEAGTGAPVPESGTASLEFSEAGTKPIDFGKIVFTEPGTYTYTVTEEDPGKGWTCEKSPQTFTVNVTMDEKTGELKAAVDKKTIKNTYKPEGTLDTDTEAQAVLKKTVVADGTAWAGENGKTFDFTIAVAEGSPEGTPLPPKTTGSATFTEAGTQVVGFGKITYTKAGTYKYTLTETTTGEEGDGWTYDNKPKEVTVNVVDNGDGTLTATVDPKAAEIENKYEPTGDLDTKTTAVLTKTVQAEGTDWAPKTFEFAIKAVDGAPLGKDADGKEVTKGTATFNEAGTQTIDFGKITYTKAGEYTYTITETTQSGNGWTCDTSDKTVIVTVVDNGDGTLTATPSAASITNVYNTKGELDTSVSPVLTKTVQADGAEWAPKTFEFTIKAVEGAPLAKDEDGNDITSGSATFTAAGTQNIDFGTITYTKAGEYKYVVQETTTGTNDGWIYDNEEKAVTVKVTDDGKGNLTATVDPAAASITNKYEPSGDLDTSVKAVLEKTVTADGTAWAPKTFNFTIAAVDGAPLAKDAEGKDITSGTATFNKAETQIIDFGTIEYTKAGTYEYTVTETTESGDGWVCDNEPKTVVVTVTDDGKGNLTAEVTTKAEIENKYEPTGTLDTAVDIVLNKVVVADGTEWGPKTFDFTIAPVGEAPAATKPNGTATFTEAGTQPIDFGTITFTAAGTYQYTVTETTQGGSGWTCDNEPKTVTVTVVDNGDGTLTASVDAAQIVSNSYNPTGTLDTKTDAVLTKTVEAAGTAWADKTFDFTIAAVTPGAPTPTKTAGTATFSEAGTKTIDFGTITFNKAGTYEYTVTETTQSGEGWTCDNEPKTVTITVTDNGDGTLTATPAAVNIKNVYEAKPVKTQIKVTKTIEGYKTDEGSADDTYVMTLAAVGDAPMPADAESGVVTTNGTGENLFGEIEYTEPGVYEYTVTEKAGDKAGVTYDDKTYNVKVTVEDNGKGQLVATVDYGAAEGSEETKTSVDVTNSFAVESVDVVMSVNKVIDDQSNSAEDATFTFVLKNSDKETLQTKTVTTDGLKGSTDFDAITFDHDGEYTFYIQESVSEEDAAKLGWTYDTNEYPVVVKISDDLSNAKLIKDGVTYDNDKSELVVTNIYKAEPTTVSDITVKKTIEDTSGSAYETTFTFTLTAGDNDVDGLDTPMPENNKASVTGEGSVTFAGIKYEKAGTYNYTVTEEASGDAGYKFDPATYNVVVTVSDEGGKLVATVDYGKDETGAAKTEIEVVNTYDPEDAKAILTATKLINDKTGSAPDATFTFELLDSEGNVIETVEHENGGTITFKELTFSKVGTYTYTIREVAGNTPGYEYDTTEHTVTITVTDPDKDGILKAKVEGNNPEIENPYGVDPGVSSVTDQISVTKNLVGRDLEDGEFTFILFDADMNVVEEVTNDADGNVVFSPITFNKVGTYTYVVTELAGTDEDITYDKSAYAVTATVTDPHDGSALQVEWSCEDGSAIVFENTYNEPPEPEEPTHGAKTGDDNNIGGWVGLMALAAAGASGLYIRRRREDEE